MFLGFYVVVWVASPGGFLLRLFGLDFFFLIIILLVSFCCWFDFRGFLFLWLGI